MENNKLSFLNKIIYLILIPSLLFFTSCFKTEEIDPNEITKIELVNVNPLNSKKNDSVTPLDKNLTSQFIEDFNNRKIDHNILKFLSYYRIKIYLKNGGNLLYITNGVYTKNITDNNTEEIFGKFNSDKNILTKYWSIDSNQIFNQSIESTITDTIYYPIGDVNGDKLNDSSIINQTIRINSDSTILDECVNKECNFVIKFNHRIPDLIINESIGVYIKTTNDINADGKNEIIVFSRWLNGNYWQYISVWSLHNNTWKKLGETKAFLSEDKDYENRIQKINSQFYLIGDNWNDYLSVEERKIKVKLLN